MIKMPWAFGNVTRDFTKPMPAMVPPALKGSGAPGEAPGIEGWQYEFPGSSQE